MKSTSRFFKPTAPALRASICRAEISFLSRTSLTRGTRVFVAAMAAAFTLISAASSNAQLLAYEPFNYAPGNAFGLTSPATTASGFSGNFNFFGEDLTIAPNASMITAGSLGYTDGNSTALTTANNSHTNGHGRLSEEFDLSGGGPFASYLEGGNIGANLTTIYISFLYLTGSQVGYNGFELFRDTAADAGRIMSVNKWSGHGSSNYHLTLGEGANGGSFSGLPPKNSNLGFTNVTSNFFVLRIDFGAANADVISIYANPLLGSEPISPTGQISGTNLAFDRIGTSSFGAGSVQMVDEIRVGTTYASVTGVPEPTSVALLATGVAMAWTNARRRRGTAA